MTNYDIWMIDATTHAVVLKNALCECVLNAE